MFNGIPFFQRQELVQAVPTNLTMSAGNNEIKVVGS